jgi:nucleoid-associated protein YgaU
MSTDYRIGLMIGAILAGFVLLRVATRPSLNPWPYPVPTTQDLTSAAESPRPVSGEFTHNPEQMRQSRPSDINDLLSSLDRPAVSRSPDLTVREESPSDPTTRIHIVRSGETLSSIAQEYYGSSNAWPRILEANKAIKDANKIALGTKLVIPE